MAANFLHGVETIELTGGPVPVQVVKSAVIGLVGLAPIGQANAPVLVNNAVEGAQFGRMVPGFSIPKALDAIFKQGAATVFVVNVYDKAINDVTETGEAHAVVNGGFKLDYAPSDNLTIDNQASQTLIEGEHYSFDAFGNVSLTSAALAGRTEVRASAKVKITGGTLGLGVNRVISILVNGVDVLGGTPVDWQTSNAATATAIAVAINTATTSPDYGATANGNEIEIAAAPGTGSGPNGFSVVVQVGGDVIATYDNALAGGVTAISATTSVTCDYDRFDPTSVTPAQLIGAIDPVTGDRTGMKCFDLTYNLTGIVAKIFIAPYYSELQSISTELIALADKFRGRALIDQPNGVTPAGAIADRGPSGTVFNTSSKRAVLLYPNVKAFDLATNANEVRPYSMYFAGVWTSQINQNGYWWSPSNREIKGIVGPERNISAAINDASTEANLLNEKGITTLFNSFGTGLRTWGNRSASFPTSTSPDNFMNVQLTADVIHESIELAMLQFVDRPLNVALISSIKETVNAFMRTLIARGAIIDGECTFDPAKNPVTELAAGHVTFDITFMPPTPTERITFESFIDINLLSQLLTA